MSKKRRKGRGNVARQKQRRRQRREYLPPAQDTFYPLIDGNKTRYVTGYCNYRKGYLSQGLMDVHRCNARHCTNVINFEFDEDGHIINDD